jgi:hypothetical protein
MLARFASWICSVSGASLLSLPKRTKIQWTKPITQLREIKCDLKAFTFHLPSFKDLKDGFKDALPRFDFRPQPSALAPSHSDRSWFLRALEILMDFRDLVIYATLYLFYGSQILTYELWSKVVDNSDMYKAALFAEFADIPKTSMSYVISSVGTGATLKFYAIWGSVILLGLAIVSSPPL